MVSKLNNSAEKRHVDVSWKHCKNLLKNTKQKVAFTVV